MPYYIKEIVFALGAMGIALVFLYNSAILSDSSALLPRILCGIIFLLAIFMAVNAVRGEKSNQFVAQKARPPVNVKRIWIFIAFMVAYVALVQPLGYFVVTPLYILSTCWYLRAAGIVKSLSLAAGFSVLVYLVFVRLLFLPVPMGSFKLFSEVIHHGIG